MNMGVFFVYACECTQCHPTVTLLSEARAGTVQKTFLNIQDRYYILYRYYLSSLALKTH